MQAACRTNSTTTNSAASFSSFPIFSCGFILCLSGAAQSFHDCWSPRIRVNCITDQRKLPNVFPEFKSSSFLRGVNRAHVKTRIMQQVPPISFSLVLYRLELLTACIISGASRNLARSTPKHAPLQPESASYHGGPSSGSSTQLRLLVLLNHRSTSP